MTVTYTEDLKPYPKTKLGDEPFTPVYARKPGTKKSVRTWMILAPIGVLVLGAGAAALLMNPAERTAPLAEPSPTLSVPAPTTSAAPAAPVETAPLVIEDAVIEPAPAPARTVRQPAPAARRAAPVVPAAQPAPRVETPPQPAGPQPYTGSLNTVTRAPVPTPPPPVVVIEPLG